MAGTWALLLTPPLFYWLCIDAAWRRTYISYCQPVSLAFCRTFSSTYQTPVQKPLPSEVHKTMLQKNLHYISLWKAASGVTPAAATSPTPIPTHFTSSVLYQLSSLQGSWFAYSPGHQLLHADILNWPVLNAGIGNQRIIIASGDKAWCPDL